MTSTVAERFSFSSYCEERSSELADWRLLQCLLGWQSWVCREQPVALGTFSSCAWLFRCRQREKEQMDWSRVEILTKSTWKKHKRAKEIRVFARVLLKLWIMKINRVKNEERRTLRNYSVQFSRSVVSDSLRPHESQPARPPCPSPTPGVHSDSRPSSQWCHPAISSSGVPFSSCPQSLPASDWFQIGKGVRQGCILPPCLFNLYAEYIMRNAGLEETQAGIKTAGRDISNLRHADDNTLMAESEEELKASWWK